MTTILNIIGTLIVLYYSKDIYERISDDFWMVVQLGIMMIATLILYWK